MKRNIRILKSVAIIIFLFTVFYYIRNPLIPKARVGSAQFFIEIAATAEEKSLGLGNRDNLKEGWGMLFPYDHKEQYNFWMKGMKFPLDFVWIADRKVVDISENIPPPSGDVIPTVTPKVPVEQILELNAGDIKKNNIQIGDTVTYILK